MKRFFMIVLFIFSVTATAQLRRDCDPYLNKINSGHGTPATFYMAGECYASNGDNNKAFEYLNLAVNNGWTDLETLETSHPLNNIKGDARWPRLHKAVYEAAKASNQLNNPQVQAIYQEDQNDNSTISMGRSERNKKRREQMHALLPEIQSIPDLYRAAVVFLRSDSEKDLMTAYDLAKRAYDQDGTYKDITMVMIQAQDKWLHAQGKPQIWGTAKAWKDGAWSLEPFNRKAKTDAEREKMGLSPLADLKEEKN